MWIAIAGASILLFGVLGKGNVKSSDKEVSPFNRWDSLIKEYAKEFGLNWTWVKAIMMNESSLGQARSVTHGLQFPGDIEGSKSSDGKSWGLMQLTLPTARMFESTVTEIGLNDPVISVRIACKFLKYLYVKKSGKQEAVVRSYNGGPNYEFTVAGQRDTPGYYQRFLRNLAVIQKDIKVT